MNWRKELEMIMCDYHKKLLAADIQSNGFDHFFIEFVVGGDEEQFLKKLETNADLFGVVWFDDQSWASIENDVEEGSYWEFHERPEIPEKLRKNSKTK